MWALKRKAGFLGLALACLLPLLQAQPTTGIMRAKPAQAERKQKVFVTGGPEVSMTLPTTFGEQPRSFSGDTLWDVSPMLRYRFGAAVRIDFSKVFALQTGLYYHSRRFQVSVGAAGSLQQAFDSLYFQEGINYIGYELPLMALFYAQLGENAFLNNAIGISIDFFPSSTEKLNTNSEFKIFNGRNSWVVPSLRASVGLEWRTESSGAFYLGGTFQRPMFALTDMFIERQEPTGPIGFQTQEINIGGSYFSIDLRYILPAGKENAFFGKSTR